MAQQTAVQCLIDEMRSGKNLQFEMTKCGHIITEHDNLFDKILQMEKEQIIKAYKKESAYMKHAGCTDKQINESAKKYYNETYGK